MFEPIITLLGLLALFTAELTFHSVTPWEPLIIGVIFHTIWWFVKTTFNDFVAEEKEVTSSRNRARASERGRNREMPTESNDCETTV